MEEQIKVDVEDKEQTNNVNNIKTFSRKTRVLLYTI